MEIIILQETGDVISKTITCLHAYFIVMKELWQAKNNITSHRGSADINTNINLPLSLQIIFYVCYSHCVSLP